MRGMDTQSRTPQGKPMHELRRLVAEDLARRDELHELWLELTESQQVELVKTAHAMAYGS